MMSRRTAPGLSFEVIPRDRPLRRTDVRANDGSVEAQQLGPRFRVLMPQGDMSHVINPMYRFRFAGAAPYPPGGLFHIPFQSDFKFAGSQPLPFGVQLGATLASYAGNPLMVNWSVPAPAMLNDVTLLRVKGFVPIDAMSSRRPPPTSLRHARIHWQWPMPCRADRG